MYIIIFIALIALAVIVTLTFSGIAVKNDELAMTGVVLLIGYLVFCFAFQLGANWQWVDTLQNYNLTPKINTHVP